MPIAELVGVALRLERAYEHIDALKHESRMFMMELPQPYAITIDSELEGGEHIVRAKVFRRPPARLGILAIDAAHNLRAALDMVAWELALKGDDPPPRDDSHTAFPICTKPEYWESNGTKRKIERIPSEAVEVIRSFQPYNRSHTEPPRLRVVQSLDNWGKHKAIPEITSFYIGRLTILSGYELISFNTRAFEDGDEVGRVRRIGPRNDTNERFHAEALCHVGFSVDGPAYGWPIDFLENAYKTISDEIVPAFQRFFEIVPGN